MKRFCRGGFEAEREACKEILLEMVPKSFSSAFQTILDRIWDRSVPLDLIEVLKGISSVEPADEALAREIIETARNIQVEAEKLPTESDGTSLSTLDLESAVDSVSRAQRRGSFGGCSSSCRESHYHMACDVCGVDYGYHRGK
jgi:hypothetical protein